ncbi:hypothetical protein TYRP_009624 [Tyrophagus putrescentiae]|nr:hypothetical protein TYRP_009624 [Tyrophagus putrescentiae]
MLPSTEGTASRRSECKRGRSAAFSEETGGCTLCTGAADGRGAQCECGVALGFRLKLTVKSKH